MKALREQIEKEIEDLQGAWFYTKREGFLHKAKALEWVLSRMDTLEASETNTHPRSIR